MSKYKPRNSSGKAPVSPNEKKKRVALFLSSSSSPAPPTTPRKPSSSKTKSRQPASAPSTAGQRSAYNFSRPFHAEPEHGSTELSVRKRSNRDIDDDDDDDQQPLRKKVQAPRIYSIRLAANQYDDRES
jgi:hypothetical protein